MASHRSGVAGAIGLVLVLASAGCGLQEAAGTGAAHHRGRCSAGAHTLSAPRSHVYPETGNGGYRSLHTDVRLVYDAASNRFLAGNHVTLTDRATQCLTSFSLDFERRSVNASAGPDMTVTSVTVNGRRAAFRFVQPTYPGDPRGQNDPDPRAHEASQLNPVGGPKHNPLPPACTPELTSTSTAGQNSKNGTQCPANKLVITPGAPIGDGAVFSVTVAYTGRPGVHNDGDGTTEGWFRSNQPKGDGGSVAAGKTVLANGVLVSRTHHPPDGQFPGGSVTWHWHSPAPVASYLVEDSVGSYDLTELTRGGIKFYQAQASSLSAARKAKNRAIMNKQPDITRFESRFSGRFPFTSDGVVVGRPPASFEEEMQTMITFAGGKIDTDTLYHENMHQWWGDHVTEASYNLTFFKEGMATFAEFLFAARRAQAHAGGPGSRAGRRAFQRSLVRQFNKTYANKGRFWTAAPSNPTPHGVFSGSATYERPGVAYIALRQILGKSNYVQALREVQRRYGGGVITEAQLEAVFHRLLPTRNPACHSRLDQFFRQWFDTAYQPGGGARRPDITGPGLAGPGFYTGSCAR